MARSEEIYDLGKNDILREFGVSRTRLVVVTGSLESVRQDCIEDFKMFADDDKKSSY